MQEPLERVARASTVRNFWAKLHLRFSLFSLFELCPASTPRIFRAPSRIRVCEKLVLKMPSNHNVDKPWDTDDIDKWKIEPFKPEDNKAGAFTEESRFSTLFPKYREQYLKASWKAITAALAKTGIACELDLTEGSMSVFTTLKTYDPAAILNARDLIKLLARSVPAPQAIKILDDQVACGMSTRSESRVFGKPANINLLFRHYKDTEPCHEQGPLREAPPENSRPQRIHAQGSGAAHRNLPSRAGKHGRCQGPI